MCFCEDVDITKRRHPRKKHYARVELRNANRENMCTQQENPQPNDNPVEYRNGSQFALVDQTVARTTANYNARAEHFARRSHYT